MKETVMKPEALTRLTPDLPLHMILNHLYLSILPATCLFSIHLIWFILKFSFWASKWWLSKRGWPRNKCKWINVCKHNTQPICV